MICPACKGLSHSAQPPGCPGGTWCDCHHRLPIEIQRQMNEESTTSSKLVDQEEGTNV